MERIWRQQEPQGIGDPVGSGWQWLAVAGSGWQWPVVREPEYLERVTGPRRSARWRQQFRAGRRALRSHRNRQALELLTAALAACPVARRDDLAAVLRLLGFACARLGRVDAALRCWVDAQRMRKHPYLARLIRSCSNDHGMPRQRHRLLDDWHAFHSLQLARYAQAKAPIPLGDAEADMLRDLLWGHFTELVRRGVLQGRSAEHRRRLFARVQISFPVLLPTAMGEERALTVDFIRRRPPAGDDPCVCGSGLPFVVCCGRIPASDEIVAGS